MGFMVRSISEQLSCAFIKMHFTARFYDTTRPPRRAALRHTPNLASAWRQRSSSSLHSTLPLPFCSRKNATRIKFAFALENVFKFTSKRDGEAFFGLSSLPSRRWEKQHLRKSSSISDSSWQRLTFISSWNDKHTHDERCVFFFIFSVDAINFNWVIPANDALHCLLRELDNKYSCKLKTWHSSGS